MKRLLLVFALLISVAGASFAQEPLEIGVTVEGELDDNMGTYTFSASAQQVIIFELNSDDFDPFLQIESADGDVLASDDDSGDSLNARLVFVAPEAGEFNVVVRSYSGDASGAFVLNSSGDVLQLSFGETVTLDLPEDGTVSSFFIGEEGDVINLIATAEEGVDTNLTLNAPDGSQLDFSEDFDGLNPVISRIILPASGMYAVLLAPYGSDDFGSVELLLEKTELPLLGAEALTIKFTDTVNREVLGIELEEGTLYEITFSFAESTSGSLEITNSDSFGSYTYFSFSNVEGASFLYRAEETGLVRAKLNNNSYSDTLEYVITAVPVGE